MLSLVVGQIITFSFYKENKEGKKEMIYLTTHSTHFIYGYIL